MFPDGGRGGSVHANPSHHLPFPSYLVDCLWPISLLSYFPEKEFRVATSELLLTQIPQTRPYGIQQAEAFSVFLKEWQGSFLPSHSAIGRGCLEPCWGLWGHVQAHVSVDRIWLFHQSWAWEGKGQMGQPCIIKHAYAQALEHTVSFLEFMRSSHKIHYFFFHRELFGRMLKTTVWNCLN